LAVSPLFLRSDVSPDPTEIGQSCPKVDRTKTLSDLRNFSGRRPILQKTGQVRCANPENARKTLYDLKKKKGENLSDFKKKCVKSDKIGTLNGKCNTTSPISV